MKHIDRTKTFSHPRPTHFAWSDASPHPKPTSKLTVLLTHRVVAKRSAAWVNLRCTCWHLHIIIVSASNLYLLLCTMLMRA